MGYIKGVNFKNLKTVPKSCNTNNYMTVGVVNVRSIKNKTVDFVDNIIMIIMICVW